MKRVCTSTIAVITLFTTSLQLCAQAPCEIDYTLTTDVNAPGNKKFSHRPNFFQWIGQEVFDVNSPNFPGGTVESPFDFQNTAVTTDLYEFKDYRIEDGWELIIERFGFEYDSDGTRTESNPEANPYFILYNKYRSILRVLVVMGEDDGAFTAASLLLKTTSTANGIMTNAIHQASFEKPLIPIDAFDFGSNPMLYAVSEYSNTTGDWFWADFPFMYDPCACLYKSKLFIDARLIYEAEINLTTTGTLIEQQPNQPADVDEDANHFSISTLLDVSDKAYRTYQSVNDFTSKELAAVDDAIDEGKVSAERGAKAAESLSFLQKSIKNSSFLLLGFKAAPFIGVAFTLIDFFTGGGQAESYAPPITFREESTTKGTLTSNSLYETIIFGNPGGTLTGFDLIEQPYYNNPLGVFAVVRTPTYDYWINETEVIETSTEDCLKGHAWDHYYFKLNSPFEFAVNPASGFEWEDAGDVEIFASLVTEFDENSAYPYVSKEVGNTNTRDFFVQEQIRRVSTRYVPLGCADAMILECKVRRDDARERPGCAWNTWFASNPEPAVLQPRVYMKLLVNLKRKDGGPNVLFAGMYPLSPGDEVTGTQNWTRGEWNTAKAHIDLIEELTVNSEFAAWETVDIKPDFALSNDATLLVTAGELITVSGEVTIPNESTLRIGTPVLCEGVVSTMDVQDLEDFCTSNLEGNYRPESRSMSKQGNAISSALLPNTGRTPIVVSKAFPNPTSNSVSLYVEVSADVHVRVNVFNELGKILGTESSYMLTRGMNKLSVDGLAGPGFHTVTLDAEGQTISRHFIVVK